MAKIRQDVEAALKSVDWENIKAELERSKNVDMKKAQEELQKAQKELERMGPELRNSLQEAKKEMEKAKAELQLYKELVDGLDQDGLINKDEAYELEHRDGKLLINGQAASNETYKKYRKVLDKKKEFRLRKSDDGLRIDRDEP